MPELVKQIEAVPAAYPDAPEGLSDKGQAVNAAALWSRIEAWCNTRWTPRAVIWIVEGEGEWTPPLSPATVSAVEVWESGGWSETPLSPSPLGGYELPGDGPYRFTATVGAGPAPAEVMEAFRRLAEYSAEIGERGMMKDAPGASSYSAEIGGGLRESFERAPTWAARALINSGAADLLRRFRRA